MPIGVNDVIRVTAGLLWNASDSIQNVFHFDVNNLGTADQEDMLNFFRNIIEDMYTEIMDVIPNNITTEFINIFNETDNEPYGSEAWPTLTVGAATGHAMPPNDSVNGFARTALNGVKGVKQWPCVDEVNHIDGLLEVDARDDYLACHDLYADSWQDGATGAQLNSGVVRSVGLGAGTLAPFIGGVLHSVLHTVRNRRQGVGG